MDILNSTVPITSFNKGLAGKIFDSVKATGIKIVMKNNQPECVLLSPKEYVKMIDIIEDYELYMIAKERMNKDNGVRYSQEDVMKMFDITQKDLDEMDDIELE